MFFPHFQAESTRRRLGGQELADASPKTSSSGEDLEIYIFSRNYAFEVAERASIRRKMNIVFPWYAHAFVAPILPCTSFARFGSPNASCFLGFFRGERLLHRVKLKLNQPNHVCVPLGYAILTLQGSTTSYDREEVLKRARVQPISAFPFSPQANNIRFS